LKIHRPRTIGHNYSNINWLEWVMENKQTQ